MLNVRTFIYLLAGVALLLQGFAVSAATLTLPPPPMEMSSMQGMPCHMEADSAADTQKNCCDHGCLDLASCWVGVAPVMPGSLLQVLPMTAELATSPQGHVPGGTLASLLRPPISLHS
jgi:hypothetical protein